MSRQIDARDEFSKALHGLLDETFDNVQGIYLDKGDSLFETLETISAEEASRPVGRCASIAAQVEHTRFYLDVCARFVRGEQVGKVDWAASWQLTSVTPAEWAALKGRLREAHRGILEIAGNPETWRKENAMGGAMGVVAHTAFHLGQIRQSLCAIER